MIQSKKNERLSKSLKNLLVVAGVAIVSSPAFAATTVDIDYSAEIAGVAILAGLVSAGAAKALPTYAAWGIRKALSMLR